ncbi:glycosyl transferase family 90 [Mesorhizobium marinum]|uniref:glycosyl transferase family 90 n=1 Tax=Mesorhizobium marinum TaxID=3228790 RepID=UPI003465D921
MEEQVAQYRYMIDVEGSGYSGRLKLLLHAGRAVLVIDRPYQDFYFGDLEPFRHYVPVSRYSSNLAEQVDWLRSNPAREKEIVGEAREFARARLTRRAAVEHWARLLEQHALAGGKLRLRSNPAREKEIVGEAREFARARLTRRAAVERWARLLEQHAHAGGKLRSG